MNLQGSSDILAALQLCPFRSKVSTKEAPIVMNEQPSPFIYQSDNPSLPSAFASSPDVVCTDIDFDFDDIIEYEIEDDPMVYAEFVTMVLCKLCGEVTKDSDTFRQHFVIHLNIRTESTKTYQCSLCAQKFSKKKPLREHMRLEHRERVENVAGTTTELIMNGKRARKLRKDPNYVDPDDILEPEHQILEKESKQKQNEYRKPMPLKVLKAKLKKRFIHKCTLKGCSYKFQTADNRDQHLQAHSSSDIDKVREFRCSECSEEFKKWRNCSRHYWRQHKIDLDMLKCPLCDYKSSLSIQIFNHIQIHGTTKGYACTYCDKKFSQITQLNQHITTHGTDKNANKPRWYSQKICEICNKVFTNSKTLSKHIKAVHNKIKPFICNVCGHKSARKSTWIIHTRQHTGEKPLHCKTCDFRAADPSVLSKHEKRHDATTSCHKCPYCDHTALQTSTIKKHVKNYHPENLSHIKCDQCNFSSLNFNVVEKHKQDHKSGLITNEDSCDANALAKGFLKRPHAMLPDKPIRNIEISSDCFLPLESTDSIANVLDTGGVTIPAHSEDTQFPTFMTP